MREFMANIILIALATAFLVHFCLLAIYGVILIQELSIIILSLEIAGLIGCIAFAIANIARLRR